MFFNPIHSTLFIDKRTDVLDRTDTAPLIEFVESMSRGRGIDEAGEAADETQAAKDEASSSGSSSGSGAAASLGVDKQYGGSYGGGYPGGDGYGGGGYPYGGGYGGYGYPSYYCKSTLIYHQCLLHQFTLTKKCTPSNLSGGLWGLFHQGPQGR